LFPYTTLFRSLFPRIGLSVQDVSLSNRDSSDTFASLDSARFAVAIWPLMFNRLVVDHVAVTGFKAWIKRDENGEFNFRDLVDRRPAIVDLGGPALAALPAAAASMAASTIGTAAAAEPQAYTIASDGGADFQIDIAGLDLRNGAIHLYDNRTASSARIIGLDVNTGRMT